MADYLSMNLMEARLDAERLVRQGNVAEGVRLLTGVLGQVYATEEEYSSVVQTLGRVLAGAGDPSGALTCAWYLGDAASADAVLPRVPSPDRARTLSARGLKMREGDARAQGLLQEAAAEHEAAAQVAQAAVCREKAGDWATARGLWSRLSQQISGGAEGDLYAAGLARFNVARTSRNVGDMRTAREATVSSVHHLEQAADRYESIGQRERAFDCFHVLVEVGRQFDTSEHVLEGYVNLIRILSEDNLRSHALQSYEEAIGYLRQREEISAAATIAQEMGAYARRQGLPAVANHALDLQAELWRQVARSTMARGGPPDIAENALLASVMCYAEIGQFQKVGAVYVELAHLPIEASRCAHYARASKRYEAAADERIEAAAWSTSWQKESAFPDVWHVDLVEWEQRGSVADACADVLLAPQGWSDVVRRRALAGRMVALRVEGARATAESLVELVNAIESIELYSMLSPMERLARAEHASVRAAVAKALGRFLYKRTFLSLRQLVADPEAAVRQEANRSLEQLRFPHAFDPLARIYRESSDAGTRASALKALAHVDTDEAAELVVGVLVQAGPGERDAVMAAVSGARNDRLLEAAKKALATAGAAGEPLHALLRARGAGG